MRSLLPFPRGVAGWPRSRAALLLILVVVLAYGNTFKNGFVWDDDTQIRGNSFIRNHTYLAAAFTSDLTHNGNPGIGYYRPLQTISYMVDYQFWGLNPFGYHLTNLLLHLSCVLLFWWIVEKLAGRRALSLAIAAIFAVHPINTNAVTYIAGRADLLAAAGMLGSLALMLEYRQRGRILLYTASLLCFVAALFSRESALILPLLVSAYCLVFDGPAQRKFCSLLATVAPYLLLALAFFLWREAVMRLNQKTLFASLTLPVTTRLAVVFRSVATYFGLIICPLRLQMERQVLTGGNWLHVLTGAGILITMGYGWVLDRARRTTRLGFFGLTWFGLAILPVTGLFNLVATLAEHWLYLPSMGLYLGVGALLFTILDGPAAATPRHWHGVAAGMVVALVGLLAGRTIARNGDWINPIRFYTKTTQAAPDSWRVRNNLGCQYTDARQSSNALQELLTAEQLFPTEPHTKLNLAELYLSTLDLDKALAKAREGVQLDPRNASAWLTLAEVHERRADWGHAKRCYSHAVALGSSVGPLLEFGLSLVRHHEQKAGARLAANAADLEPGNADVYNLWGAIYADRGDYASAKTAFQRAQALDRHNSNAAVNLGRLAWENGDLATAHACYRRALRLQPTDPRARYQLGLIYWRQGNREFARQQLAQAQTLAPNSALVRNVLLQLERGNPYRAPATGSGSVP